MTQTYIDCQNGSTNAKSWAMMVQSFFLLDLPCFVRCKIMRVSTCPAQNIWKNHEWTLTCFCPCAFPKAFGAVSITKQVSGACGELVMKTGHSKDPGRTTFCFPRWVSLKQHLRMRLSWCMMDAIDDGCCDFPPHKLVERDKMRNSELVAFVSFTSTVCLLVSSS